ncbi:Replication stress response regulator SDE2 [Bienertia sinuspersici]
MAEPNIIQFFVKLFDNKTLTLQFPTHQTLTPQSIKHQIQTLTKIPIESQNLTLNGKFLSNSIQIPLKSLSLSTIYLNLSLLGGKGGFGSLLRGAATKAGQKKTNNFDACRDMSGRRLRHVNAEKRMEEWRAEEEDRKMEKMAEQYLKKMEKKGKGGKKDEGAEKYVELYRQESRRCVEEVERSVRESVGELLGAGNKKRKFLEKFKSGSENGDAKKLKIWMGKRKVGEADTDSDDSDGDTEGDDSDAENEKSVVTENGSQSDSSKDASSVSLTVLPSDGENHSGRSSESGSEEEKEIVKGGSTGVSATCVSNGEMNGDSAMETSAGDKKSASAEVVSTSAKVVEQAPREYDSITPMVTEQLPCTTTSVEPDCHQLATVDPELDGASERKAVSPDEAVTGSSNASEDLQPLNFDNYNSAAELEVLGMERLKSELQARQLKCGGTLQERAARLFLLKTTPLEKLPKKLLAKK